MTIFEETLEKVRNGSRFSINLQAKSLKVDGKFVIKDGSYEGELGVDKTSLKDMIKHIEELFAVYKHSRPSERSERRAQRYFKAIPEKDMAEEDMLYGIGREESRCELELYILCSVINGTFNWTEMKLTYNNVKWFWQSDVDKDLIILKTWIVA